MRARTIHSVPVTDAPIALRSPRLFLLCTVALTAFLTVAAPAAGEQQSSSSGQVRATFFYYEASEVGFEDLWLTIDRAGLTAYDELVRARYCEEPWCYPASIDRNSVHVRDLDGDDEPEVLLDLFTGGAHCCFVTQIFSFDGFGYRKAREHNWGDPGYRLSDLDADGSPELRTADPRFAYRFAAYAFSRFPLKILRWRDGRLVNVTRRFPALIRRDAKRWMRTYRRARIEPQGALAAWAADQYSLGRRAKALRVVRREIRSGKLRTMPGSSRFARKLDRKLRRWGYY